MIKSNKKDMQRRGYIVNNNKEEAYEAMENDRSYLVVDITNDDIYTELTPIVRSLHKFNKKDLAEHISRSISSISMYESGKRQPDSVAKLKLSSFILGRGVYSDRYKRSKDKRKGDKNLISNRHVL